MRHSARKHAGIIKTGLGYATLSLCTSSRTAGETEVERTESLGRCGQPGPPGYRQSFGGGGPPPRKKNTRYINWPAACLFQAGSVRKDDKCQWCSPSSPQLSQSLATLLGRHLHATTTATVVCARDASLLARWVAGSADSLEQLFATPPLPLQK